MNLSEVHETKVKRQKAKGEFPTRQLYTDWAIKLPGRHNGAAVSKLRSRSLIEFEEGISKPENWLRQSWQMFEASKALYLNMSADEVVLTEQDTFRQVGAFKGAMLLLGLAVENALKGAFVHQFPPDLSRDRLDQNHFKEKGSAHDLVAIADKMNFHLSAEKFELLKRLTVFIEWASRYQAPLRKAEHKNAKGNLKLNWPSDYQLVETLINELQLLAGYKVGHGW